MLVKGATDGRNPLPQTSVDISSIRLFGIYFNQMWVKFQTFSFKKKPYYLIEIENVNLLNVNCRPPCKRPVWQRQTRKLLKQLVCGFVTCWNYPRLTNGCVTSGSTPILTRKWREDDSCCFFSIQRHFIAIQNIHVLYSYIKVRVWLLVGNLEHSLLVLKALFLIQRTSFQVLGFPL